MRELFMMTADETRAAAFDYVAKSVRVGDDDTRLREIAAAAWDRINARSEKEPNINAIEGLTLEYRETIEDAEAWAWATDLEDDELAELVVDATSRALDALDRGDKDATRLYLTKLRALGIEISARWGLARAWDAEGQALRLAARRDADGRRDAA